MAEMKEQNNFTTASSLLDLVSKYRGTTSTSTTSSNISKAGVDAMIQEILGGTQGLAAVAQGQKSAGGYNSSTQQLLFNDLIARTTAQVAKAQAGTTTVNRTAGVGSKNLTKAGLLLGALAKGDKAYGKDVKAWYEKFTKTKNASAGADNAVNAAPETAEVVNGLSSFGESSGASLTGFNLADISTSGLPEYSTSGDLLASLAESLYGGELAGGGGGDILSALSGVGEGAETAQGANYVATSADRAALFGDAGYGATAAETSSVSLTGQGTTLGYAASALDAYQASQTDKDYRRAVGGAILNYFGAGWATPVVAAVAEPISDAAMNNSEDVNGIAGAAFAEPIGTVASGNYNQGDILSAVTDPADFFGGNEGGSVNGMTAQILDPLGSMSGSTTVKDALDGITDTIEDTVICTELNRQGILSDRLYAVSQLQALELSSEIKRGYHYWAVPIVRKMRKSPRLTAFLAPIVQSRCEYLTGSFRVLGWLTVHVGQPICAVIGHLVSATNYKALYHG